MRTVPDNLREFLTHIENNLCPSNYTLDLSHNYIDNTDIEHLIKTLRRNRCPNGLTLNLSENSFSYASAQSIANTLFELLKQGKQKR